MTFEKILFGPGLSRSISIPRAEFTKENTLLVYFEDWRVIFVAGYINGALASTNIFEFDLNDSGTIINTWQAGENELVITSVDRVVYIYNMGKLYTRNLDDWDTITEIADLGLADIKSEAVLDKSPCYRVDLYDHRWFASDVECAVSWNPVFVFEKLQKIWDRLKEDFGRQTSAPGYRLDEMVLELGDRFHLRVMSYLCVMLPAILKTEAFEKKFENVKVYGGEYLDQFYILSEGGAES